MGKLSPRVSGPVMACRYQEDVPDLSPGRPPGSPPACSVSAQLRADIDCAIKQMRKYVLARLGDEPQVSDLPPRGGLPHDLLVPAGIPALVGRPVSPSGGGASGETTSVSFVPSDDLELDGSRWSGRSYTNSRPLQDLRFGGTEQVLFRSNSLKLRAARDSLAHLEPPGSGTDYKTTRASFEMLDAVKGVEGWAVLYEKQMRYEILKKVTAKMGGCQDNILLTADNLLPCWSQEKGEIRGSEDAFWDAVARLKTRRDLSNFRSELVEQNSFIGKVVMRPGSRVHLLHGLISSFIILHDFILFPVHLSFGATNNDLPWQTAMQPAALLFWTMDLVLQFFVGYFVSGVLELRISHTSRHYIRTSFLPDFLVIIMEWFRLYFERLDENSPGQLGMRNIQQLKIIVFTFRLSRLFKLKRVLNEGLDSCRSQVFAIFARITVSICSLLIIAHYIACFWCLLALAAGDADNWIQRNLDDEPVALYVYITSLHWTLTQFTPATNNVAPQNVYERVFAVVIVLFAMLTFSTFLGVLTTQVSTLRNLNSKRDREEAMLRSFFRGKVLTLQLQKCIWAYFHEHFRRRRNTVSEEDIQFFKHVPDSILQALHGELYRTSMVVHPLLAMLSRTESELLDILCHKGVRVQELQKLAQLFNQGVPANAMYIVNQGSFTYDTALYACPVQLEVDSWASEFALWVKWTHKGSLVAASSAGAVQVNVSVFHELNEVMGPVLRRSCKSYARRLMDYYSMLIRPVTDVIVDDEERQDILDIVGDAWTEYSRCSEGEGSQISRCSDRKSTRLSTTGIMSRLSSVSARLSLSRRPITSNNI